MDLSIISFELAINMALLLLIGMGPKVALVPFLEKTKHFDPSTQRAIGRQMVVVAVVTAVVLLASGWLLLRLLHITGAAVAIAGGIILAVLAIPTVAGLGQRLEVEESTAPANWKQLAVYPLAVPYLLNPAGITILVIASAEIVSVQGAALMLGLILAVGAFDYLVFSNIEKLSKRLNPITLTISEVVFGILLTAVGVQLVVFGLGEFGVVSAAAH